MPINDTDTPFSDGWWLRRLHQQLNARPTGIPTSALRESRRGLLGRRDWMDLLWSYNIGEAPLPRVSQSYRAATREFLRMARANYGPLAVKALADRVTLNGARTGADNDANGDDVIRVIHTANGAWLKDTLGYAFALGEGYTIIGKGDEADSALITAEDPRQVIVAPDPVRPHVARAALKVYRDDAAGEDVAHLFLPAGKDPVSGDARRDRVHVAVRSGGAASVSRFNASSWEWDEGRSGDLPDAVQGMGVPVVRWENELGQGEFEPHLDLLDRINNMIADRLWTSKLQAYRQRALKAQNPQAGPIPEKDEDGNDIDLNDVFEADPGALWELPAGWEVWESQVVDLTPILSSVRDDVREFSAVTRTPLSMFAPEGENQSAAGADNANDGLVFKAKDRITRMTPAALRTYRFALAFAGQPERAKGALECIWESPQRYSLTDRATAAAAAKSAGMPFESVMSEAWQASPETVARMVRQRAADLLFEPAAPTSSTPASGGTGA